MASITRSTRIVRNSGFDLHLGQKINHVLRAAVQLGVAFLATEAFDLGHRNALYANTREGFTHLVELERFDDSRIRVS
jgi:hypothetical protein